MKSSDKSCKSDFVGNHHWIFFFKRSKSCIAFEYDDAFLNSGIEVSPIMMPLSKRLYEFPDLIQTSFKGSPGLLADSLPDKFGNAVID